MSVPRGGVASIIRRTVEGRGLRGILPECCSGCRTRFGRAVQPLEAGRRLGSDRPCIDRRGIGGPLTCPVRNRRGILERGRTSVIVSARLASVGGGVKADVV